MTEPPHEHLLRRRYENAAAGIVVAAFAAVWVTANAGQAVPAAVQVVLLATPGALAARCLIRFWWRRSGHRLSTMDPPARVLAVAVGSLPEDRRAWGAAMLAELAEVRGRGARWAFATGCARTAIFPPSRGSMPLLTGAGTAAAALVTMVTLGQVLPAMRVFGVTFVGCAGVLATLMVARAPRARPDPVILLSVLLGVAGCVAVTGYLMADSRNGATELQPALATLFAGSLAGILCLGLTQPHALTTSRLARRSAVVAALFLGAGLLAASRIASDQGVLLYLLCTLIGVFFFGCALVAWAARSFLAGVQAAVWTAVLGALVTLVFWQLEAMRWYRDGVILLLTGDSGMAVGLTLGDTISATLMFFLFWGIPLGVLGAGMTAGQRRRFFR